MAKIVLELLSTECRIKEREWKGFVVLSMDFKNKIKQYLTSASHGVLLLQFSYFFWLQNEASFTTEYDFSMSSDVSSPEGGSVSLWYICVHSFMQSLGSLFVPPQAFKTTRAPHYCVGGGQACLLKLQPSVKPSCSCMIHYDWWTPYWSLTLKL